MEIGIILDCLLKYYLQSTAFAFVALFLVFWGFFPCLKDGGWLDESPEELVKEYELICAEGFWGAIRCALRLCWIPVVRVIMLMAFTYAAFFKR